MRGHYNPELGFFPFVDTVAYMMDIDPSKLDRPDIQAALRKVFDEGRKPLDGELVAREMLSAQVA